ncbi:MAG: ABC transporter permease [Verrucomicrobia bacterium]|nr:ABC transporter permease [Verrucomicrobiota bacterium]
MSDLLGSVRLAWSVVVRNWVVYRKDFIANISPTLADPALMLTALGMGLSPFISSIHGLSYSQYLAPGMAATTVLFTAFFECSYGFYVRMTFESVFKAMLTTPIGTGEVVLGEFIWVSIRAALMAGGVGIVLELLSLLPNPWAVFLFPLIGAMLAIPCGAIGLLASSYVRNINQFQTVYSFIIAPLYFISGTFFPLNDRPVLGALVQVSPFFHGVSLLQMAAWNQFSPERIAYHLSVMLSYALILGLWSLARIRKKLIN